MTETQKTELTQFLYNRWIDEHSLVDSFLDFLEDQKLIEDQTLAEEDALITVLDQIQEAIFIRGLTMPGMEHAQSLKQLVTEGLWQEFLQLVRLGDDQEKQTCPKTCAEEYSARVLQAGSSLRQELAEYLHLNI